MKTETECSALDVKLKHARNQVDVEIKRRQRAEADCEKLASIMLPIPILLNQGVKVIWPHGLDPCCRASQELDDSPLTAIWSHCTGITPECAVCYWDFSLSPPNFFFWC